MKRKAAITIVGLGLFGLAVAAAISVTRHEPAPSEVEVLIGDMDWFVDEFTPSAYECSRILVSQGTFGWTGESCRYVDLHFERALGVMERSDGMRAVRRNDDLSTEQSVALLQAHNRYQHARLIISDFPQRIERVRSP